MYQLFNSRGQSCGFFDTIAEAIRVAEELGVQMGTVEDSRTGKVVGYAV